MLLESDAISEPSPEREPPGTPGQPRYSRRQTVINAATSWADMICQGLVGLVTVPLLLTALTREGFGLLCVLNIIVVYAGYSDIGIRSGVGRDLTEYIVRKDGERFTRLMTTSCLILSIIAIVLSVVLFLFAEQLARLLGVPNTLVPVATNLIPVYCGVYLVTGLLTPVFASVVMAFNRFDLVNVTRTFSVIIPPLTTLPWISESDVSIYWWCGAACIGQLSCLSMTAAIAFYLSRHLLRFPQLLATQDFWRTMKFGLRVFGIQLSSMLGSQSDLLVISGLKGSSLLAVYNPAARVAALTRPFVAVLANTLCPTATAFHSSQDRERLRLMLVNGTRYQMLLGVLVFTILVTSAHSFCVLWIGPSLGDDCNIVAKLLIVMACVDLFEYAAGTQWPVLMGMRQVDFLLATQVPFTALNIALTVIFVGFTPLGIYGAVLATGIASGIRRPLVCIHVARTCGMSGREYFVLSYAIPLSVGVFLVGVGLAAQFLIPQISWPRLMLHICILAGAWTACILAVGLSSDERRFAIASAASLVGCWGETIEMLLAKLRRTLKA
ncbi:MAG: lipopolysaccharide biosynthesis protein [Planctomycetota bacterium]